jgi:predicted aspartyl protease
MYEKAINFKPKDIEATNKRNECNYFIRLNEAKKEKDIDKKPILNSKKQVRIPLTQKGNTHFIKAKINGTLSFDFILDTGADNVLVAPDVFMTFYKAGLITNADIIGKQHFSIADGTTVNGLKFYLREIQIGDIVLNNVEASIISGGDYEMLLGGSVFKKNGTITIDYNNNVLIIEK